MQRPAAGRWIPTVALVVSLASLLLAFVSPHLWLATHARVSGPIPSRAYGDGTYRVGTTITAGPYESNGGPDCVWARRTDRPRPGSVLTVSYTDQPRDDRIIAAGIGTGHVVVYIEPTDYDFTTGRCDDWTRIEATPP
jgi:hypothetical protein